MPFAVEKFIFFSRASKINHTVLCSHFLAAAPVTCRFYYSLICWIDDIWKENEINRNHFDSLRAMWMCAMRNGANDKRFQRKNIENILCQLLRSHISSATIAMIKFVAIFFSWNVDRTATLPLFVVTIARDFHLFRNSIDITVRQQKNIGKSRCTSIKAI